MAGKSPGPFPNCDWRFNEFPNPAAHALHVTCVELMALAVPGKDVGNALLNVVLKRYVGSLKLFSAIYNTLLGIPKVVCDTHLLWVLYVFN